MVCPKCKGLVDRDEDRYGSFIFCRNCGWTRDLEINGDLMHPWYKEKKPRTPKSGGDSYSRRVL